MRSRTIPSALAVLVALGVAWTEPVLAAPADTEHLPDLRTLKPSELRLVNSGHGTVWRLRLTNRVWNAGPGPLYLRPENEGDVTTAHQRIFSHDANGDPYMVRDAAVGEFEFHPQHNHWHLEGFARYDLRNVAPGGGIGPNILASASKVSFCLLNNFLHNGALEHVGWGPGGSCDEDNVQGIKVGYGDIYDYSLPGQAIDVTDVPGGTYWLVSTADPEDQLEESNNTNNAGAVKIRIRRSPRGSSVVVVG